MAYDLMTREQKRLIAILREFQESEIAPIVKEIDENARFPMEVHDKLGELGFHGMNYPKEYGGMGLDLETNLLCRAELSRVDAGFGCAYPHGKGVGGSIFAYGTEEQKRFIADFALHGGIGSSALTELDAGSHLSNLKTEAKKVGNEYVINGSKAYIMNGPLSTIFFVLAYTDKSKGLKGMSILMVESDRPGFKKTNKYNAMGIRSCETCDLEFKDVVIPADHIVGAEGAGYAIMLSVLNKGRVVNMSPILGIGQAALDFAVAYSKERVTFGVPICQHQGVQFLLAEMEMRVQAARQYMLYGVRMLMAGKGKQAAVACSGAKAFATEAILQVTADAIQICGARGYSKDFYVEKLMRDAKAFSIFEGTNQIQRMLIGKTLSA